MDTSNKIKKIFKLSGIWILIALLVKIVYSLIKTYLL